MTLATRLLEYARAQPVHRSLEATTRDGYSAKWELFSDPAEPPVLTWMNPPESLVLSRVALPTPHGMPWEGRLVMRHPHEKKTEAGQPLKLRRARDVAWRLGSYAATVVEEGSMTHVRLFPTRQLEAALPELRAIRPPTPDGCCHVC